jgi:prepilin-type N-terminal cleavage/methylation domain-containing protein
MCFLYTWMCLAATCGHKKEKKGDMNGNMIVRKPSRLRGFTLVELIVVIAIVAILAAVSIVGYRGYIDKARASNDVTDARNMTNVLKSYLIANDVGELDADDIRSIVNIDNDYSFVPRVQGTSFWYDEETQEISVRGDYDAVVEDLTLLSSGRARTGTHLLSDTQLGNDGTTNPGDKLEEVINGFLLLDTAGSTVAEAINSVRNLRSSEEYDNAYLSLSDIALLQGHLDNFDLSNTLFVNDFFGLTQYVFDPLDPVAVNIIFADGIEALPPDALGGLDGNTNPEIFQVTITLPITVSVVQQGALLKLSPGTRVVTPDRAAVQIETGSINPLTTANGDLLAAEKDIVLHEIAFRTNYTKPKTSFYTPLDGLGIQSYLGKTVTEDIVSPEMVDEHFLKIYPKNGYSYAGSTNLPTFDPADPLHAGSFAMTHAITTPLDVALGEAEELAMTNVYWPDPDEYTNVTVGTSDGYDTLTYNGTPYLFGDMGWTDGETLSVTNWDFNVYRITDPSGTFIGEMIKSNIVLDPVGASTDLSGYVFKDTSGAVNPFANLSTSAFSAFDPNETVFASRMYDIEMKNGDTFSFATSMQGISYVNNSGHMTLLTIPMVVTNVVYDAAHEAIGSYEETKLDYIKNSWNWHFSVYKNMDFLSTYGWQGHSTVFSGGYLSAAYDAEGATLDPGTFDTLPSYAFAFSDTPSMTVFQSNVQIYLKENTDIIIYGLHVTYRTIDGVVLVEAKGYDEEGRLFAKGSMRYVETFVETNTLSLS